MASGSVFRRSGGWCNRLDIAPDPDTGKRRQRSRQGFRTRREALDALNAELVGAAAGVTVGEFLKRWLSYERNLVRASTLHSYRSAIGHVTSELGEIPVARLTAADVSRFETDLVNGDEDRDALSRRTVANIHAVFHQAMNIAVRDGLCSSNPVARVRPPRPERRDSRVWTMDEIRQFLAITRTHRFHVAFLMLATTGMRRGEVLGLRWTDVDLDQGWVSITHTVTEVAGRTTISAPKTTAARRRIDLDTHTTRALADHRKHSRPDAVYVFEATGGGPVNPASFSATFQRLVARAGVPRIRLHNIRHTYASFALHHGMHPLELSERLGHSTVSVTMDVYSHLIPQTSRHHLDNVIDQIFGYTTDTDPQATS